MQPSRISYLITQLVAGRITELEKEELDELLLSADPEELSDEIVDLIPESPTPAFDETLMPVAEKVLQLDRRAPDAPARIGIFRKQWLPYAAAVVALISVACYFWLNGSVGHSGEAVAKSVPENANKIHPGMDGAILTLADGTKIVLDSMANGAISLQGNSRVLLKNGRVAYLPVDSNAKKILFNTMTTPKGRQYQLALPDGTIVWLNASSSITYPTAFTGPERKVSITGEAYFEVAKDAKKRFLVTAGLSTTEALGTHFNVNAYGDEKKLSITLLEGSIKVSEGVSSKLVSPGQQAVIGREGEIGLSKNVDIEQVMAWKNGWFNFERTNILTIMKQIDRWYNVEVIYESDVDQMDFSGAIQRKTNISEVLKFLEMTGVVHFRVEGQKIYVSK